MEDLFIQLIRQRDYFYCVKRTPLYADPATNAKRFRYYWLFIFDWEFYGRDAAPNGWAIEPALMIAFLRVTLFLFQDCNMHLQSLGGFPKILWHLVVDLEIFGLLNQLFLYLVF